MITCVYQPLPLTGSIRDSGRISGPLNMNNNRNCLVKVHKDSKRVIVSRFTEGGKYSREKVKVELIPTSIELINKKIEQLGLLNNNNNNNDDNDNDNDNDEDSKPSISETCGLSLSELEAMATRQARLLENQEQLLAAKSQRLRFLKNGGGGDAEKLQKIRDKWATQEERLRKLRAIRGKVQTSKSTNSILSSDLESLKAVFNEKEKELSLAVAHVEELSKQLEELRRGGKNDQITGQQTEKELEVDRLRRELNYRQKLRDAQATRVQAQRAALGLRHDEIIKVDRRIAELQERLHRKRLLNHQLASTLKHQEIVDDFIPNKNDPKYQTLPYNTKLFSPFSAGKQHQNQQEMDNNGLPSPQMQMQIHHSESQLKRDLHGGGPNVLNHSFSNGFQQQQQQQQQQKFHQQQLQQHHNAKLMSSSVLQSQIQQQSISINNSNQYPVSSTIVSNGLQMVHSTQANSNVSWGKAIPLSSTSGDHQQYQNKIIKSSTESQEYNFESSFSQNQNSSSSNIGLENHQNQNDGTFRAGVLRPTLPPKPSKPTPPPRQTYDAFSYSPQRSSETIQDRTELPIKPKPLFLVQERKKNYSSGAASSSNSNISSNLNTSSSSGAGETTGGAGSLLGDSAKDNSVISSIKNNNSASASSSPATNANTNTTVRVSINRRIQMPPDFFFPESDPPPSDLLVPPEITTQAPTSTTTLTTTTTTSTSVCDSVDAAVISHPNKNNLFNSNYNNQNSSSSSSNQPEEYTLPDLFSTSDSNTLALALDGGNVIKDTVENSAEHKIDTCTDLRKPNLTLTEPLGSNKSKSLADNQNNQNQANQASEENENQNMNVKKSENSISLMEIHIEPESPKENVQKELTSESQLDALESNVDSGCGNSSNSPEREDSTSDTSNSSNSLTLSSSTANVVKRVKKGNLKSANRDHLPVGRRVSFDPLALLLDASLEGELDLVIKTAGDVGNPSAANDEGITALHNAICASHPEVVKFLVEFGCDVNAADSDGWTPLHCAASCNNAGMVKFLVERGACIFATTLSDQETAADKCEEKEDGYGPCSDYLYSIQEKLGIMNNGAVYAVFDYEAHNPDELTFREGDRLVALRKGDEVEREWWWTQNENNEQGYIPRNLLGLYPRVMPQRHNNPE